MSALKVVDGKLSENYNHFLEYDLESCLATNTRLMGVVAMHITWSSKDNPKDKLHQIIHLDYSEYGVDDYFEFECTRGTSNYKENHDEAIMRWDNFVRVMGGDVIKITPEIMLGLIDSAIPLADNALPREYDTEENAEFRTHALLRFGLMKEALASRGITALSSEQEVISQTSLRSLTTTETINYFVMRLIDLDFSAASYLSTIPVDELKENFLTKQGIQTLIRNKIRRSDDPSDIAEDGTHPYRLKMTTLGQAGYYYCTLVVYLDKNYKERDAKVTDIRVGSINKLSEYEAAVQLRVTEYITIFDCRDRILNGFDGNRIEFLNGVEPQQVPNGWLWTVYNRDNSHVNKADYWLNDDVYGYALLTIDGEFVLMSNKIRNISYMDECTMISMYAPFMELDGRYQLEDPIFHTFCNTYGVMFRQLIDYPPDEQK